MPGTSTHFSLLSSRYFGDWDGFENDQPAAVCLKSLYEHRDTGLHDVLQINLAL